MEVRNTIKAFGEVMMRLEAPNHMMLEQSRELQILYTGTGVNILSALSRYGHDTSIITKLPGTSLGNAAIAYIRSLGMSSSDIIRGGEYLGMYFLERGFDRRSTKVTYTNRQESSFCTSNLTEYDWENILTNTSMIHLCGITLAISEHTRNMTLQVAKKAKQLGITVAFDFNYRPKLWNNNYEQARHYYKAMLQFVDICFMTEKDAQYILDMETNEKEQHHQIEDVIPKVAKKYSLTTIAGTIRKHEEESQKHTIQGFMYHHSSVHYSREYVYKIFDQIGAGDGFSSGIMHGISHHFSVEDTVEFSTAACVLAHSTYGDSPICSAEEVWSLVNKNEVQIER